MKKYELSSEHKEKRAQKKHFVLRYDILGTPLMYEILPHEYFDLFGAFPDVADKIVIDGMYSGDWYSVYDSQVLPLRRSKFLGRFRASGVDLFGEWVRLVHKRGKECWLSHRISEIDIDPKINPPHIKEAHPDWFIPAFGHKMNNIAVPEIREHKLRVLAEVMRKYDFDGLDIDFERHTPILPVGKQWEMRECVTDLMRNLRELTLKIGKEKGKVIMLSARVPDCLKGCHEDGLDIETWIAEELVDCLTLGSRSFDIKVEEFRVLSDDIQIYGCYDPHHTVDGYAFPEKEVIWGVWYSHLQRGADGIEYFNWSGQGDPTFRERFRRYAYNYGFIPDLKPSDHTVTDKDDLTRADDREFIAAQNKTYVIDRRGGYPWGVGYGNLNSDRQLPCVIEREGEVSLYVAEETSTARKLTLRLLFEELRDMPEIYFNGQKLCFTSAPHRDMQVTTEKEAPTSGANVISRLSGNIDMSKPCTMLTSDVTKLETKIGYNKIRIVSKAPISLEKAELEIKKT